MSNDVGEAAVEGHEYTCFVGCCTENLMVRSARESFLPRKLHVVTGLSQSCPNGVGHVLVQLDR